MVLCVICWVFVGFGFFGIFGRLVYLGSGGSRSGLVVWVLAGFRAYFGVF